MSDSQSNRTCGKRYPRTILATACIPWTESFELDEAAFRREIRGLIARGIRHIYVFGTAGEGYAITDEQFRTIVAILASEMPGPDLFPMVGLISLSLPQMLQRLQTAYQCGIRDFQFALPSWGVLTDDELSVFVHQLCDPFPDCRFLHYNLQRSKRLLGIRDYEKLAAEVPNFVGVKYSTSDIATILELAGSTCPLQFFLTELGFAYGSLVSEFGFLLSLGTTNIPRAREFFQAAVDGKYSEVLQMQQELFHMVKALLQIAGGTRIDGAYDKIFCKVLDPSFPLRLLPPYIGTNDHHFKQYCEFLEQEYPQWLED